MKDVPTVADQLRKALAAAESRGMTRGQIAAKSGISQAALSRFARGEAKDMGLANAERLAAAIKKKIILR